MKRILKTMILGVCLLALTWSCWGLCAEAETYTTVTPVLMPSDGSPLYNTLNYTYDERSKTATITGYIYLKKGYSSSPLDWDTKKIIVKDAVLQGDLSYLFFPLTELQSIEFVNSHVVNVTSMRGMFQLCEELNSLDLSCFETERVTDMTFAFAQCSSLTNVKINHLDFRRVTSMESMFGECTMLKSMDLSGLNTGNLETVAYMFDGCTSLKEVKLDGMQFGKVSSAGCMFQGCRSLTTLDMSTLDLSKLFYVKEMFKGCSSLAKFDASNWKFDWLDGSPFEGLKGEIILPGNLKSIKRNNFYNLDITTKVVIPRSVETIDDKSIGYSVTYNSDGLRVASKILGFIIYGYEGTAAESYASLNNFCFANIESPIDITSQPKGATIGIGETAELSVVATIASGTATYQWQQYVDDKWQNLTCTGAKTATLHYSSNSPVSARPVRCVITDSKGNTQNSVTVSMNVWEKFGTPEYKKDVYTQPGKDVVLTVTCEGPELKYQWYVYQKDEGFVKASPVKNDNTFTVWSVQGHMNGAIYKCVVTDKYGRKAETGVINLHVSQGLFYVTTQPKNATSYVGDAVSFRVETTDSEKMQYQWQKSTDGGKTWVNSTSIGAATANLTLTSKVSFNGYQFRCVISDAFGRTTTSNAATLKVLSTAITACSGSVTAQEGAEVKFSVTATGNQLSYQWEKSKDGGKTWEKCVSAGAATKCLIITAKRSFNGYQFRCKVTGGDKTVTSAAMKLTVQRTLTITSQPTSKTVATMTNVSFRIGATGDGLTYRWEKSTDGGKTWTTSGSTGARTNTLTISTRMSYTGMKLRCEVTDKYGNKVTSNEVTLKVTK